MKKGSNFHKVILIAFALLFIAALFNTDNGCAYCLFPPFIIGPLLLIIGPLAGISIAILILNQKNRPYTLSVALASILGLFIGGIGLLAGVLLTFLVGLH